ncbi:hypothetical protein M3Y99_01742200 [Aphelenchoides fujianensis]|nr:hypothetical protein M3Y99_01742200 [Aphelenchoides fujianensis]
MIFATVSFTTSIQCFGMHGRYYEFSSMGVFSSFFGQQATSIAIRLYFWIVIYMPCALVFLDFIYRFRILFGEVLSLGWVIRYVIASYSILGLIAFGVHSLYFTMGPSEKTVQFDGVMAAFLNVSKAEIPAYQTSDMLNPVQFTALLLLSIVIFAVYSFVAYVMHRVRRETQNNDKMNRTAKVQAANRQIILLILVVQAMVPVVLFVPILANVACALLNTSSLAITHFSYFSLSLAAAFKPLATIAIVPSFRRAFLFKHCFATSERYFLVSLGVFSPFFPTEMSGILVRAYLCRLFLEGGPSPQFDQTVRDVLSVKEIPPYMSTSLRSIPLNVVLSAIVLLSVLNYAFISFVTLRIRRTIRHNAGVARVANGRTQTQIGRIIFVQALAPIFICIPIVLNVGSSLVGLANLQVASFCFLFVETAAAFKPLAAIIIVPQFRAAAFCNRQKRTGVQALTNYNSPNALNASSTN